jgi:plasmid maintenance system killer protein
MVTGDAEANPEGHDEQRAPPLYRDKRTARFANGERVREFQAFEEQAKKRLLILRSAVSRQGLMLLPSNRLSLRENHHDQNRKSPGLSHSSRHDSGR